MASPATDTSDPAPRGLPTYHARRGRLSALSKSRLDTLLPARRLPEGILDPRTIFGRSGRLVVEIGAGHGDSAVAYAVTHPECDVVAAEVHRAGMARLLASADRFAVPNLRVELGDGVSLLTERFPRGSVSEIHVWFPDPWPKARHAKRRIIRPGILDLFAERLAPSGVVLLASDHAPFMAYAEDVVRSHGRFAWCPVDRPVWRPSAGFEDRARTEGREPAYVELRRLDPSG